MSASISSLVADLQPFARQLVQVASDNDLQPIVTSCYRTYAEQAALYKKYLAGQSAYPASPPGVGSHERGWAFDMVVNDLGFLPALGEVWESWGGAWGGRWNTPDTIHFELAGASAAARAAGEAGPKASGLGKYMALAADGILALNPAIGIVELGAFLYSLGFPQSSVAAFLGGPVEYIFGYTSASPAS